MKKNFKRSVFSVALCAMLVFCVSFYSSAEPTTAWFSDTDNKEGKFNMDEIAVLFEGDAITGTQAGSQTAATVELNFKAATKAVDKENANKPEPMFEYAAEFYTFKATNYSDGVTARLRAEVVSDNAQVNYRVYELGEEVTADGVELYIEGAADGYDFDDVYVKTVTSEDGNSTEERVLKIGEKYYDAALVENLDNTGDLLLAPGQANSKTYCIAVWFEYTDFDTPEGVDTVSCSAELKISAEQVQEAETTSTQAVE